MGDVIDRANDLAERERESALAAACASLATGPGSAECRECGDAIPPDRRKALPATTMCVGCAEIAEAREAQFAR